ncbi:MAG TPA: hypothetical protein VEJ84_08595, partial [Acidimicrobiales bacterium]|nr:hypothetical protein [Acidimicrobiales bacterium]
MDSPKATSVAVPPDRAPAASSAHPASSSPALIAEDVADAKAAMEATYGRPDQAGVCVADGYGVKVMVNKGALVVHDGI